MKKITYQIFTLSLLVGLLSGCGSSSAPSPPTLPPAPMLSFDVSVSNLTNDQPMSPVAILVHDGSYQTWAIGMPASEGLEDLAESGSPASLGSEAVSSSTSVYGYTAGTGMIAPGNSETITVTFEEESVAVLSMASMLVNTNDAFVGAQNVDLSQLDVGDSSQLNLMVFDAGTEGNTETAASVPGPASGGEGQGFNAVRDDLGVVTRHSGVVTSSDGYSASVLTEAHRFESTAAQVTIRRTQ